jgi:REP element-mobilizing transposase RayT
MGKLTFRNFLAGNHYHVIIRGNNKQEIFLNDSDRRRLVLRLEEYSGKYNIKILCYALMPNHVHLLLRQDGEISISKFMQAINTGYTMYFNLKHNRSGHLFQGRFHSTLVDSDEYLIQLSRYIHLNPIKAGLTKRIDGYPWSSYLEYVGRRQTTFVETDFILSYFSKKNRQQDYKTFVKAGSYGETSEELQPYTLE